MIFGICQVLELSRIAVFLRCLDLIRCLTLVHALKDFFRLGVNESGGLCSQLVVHTVGGLIIARQVVGGANPSPSVVAIMRRSAVFEY
jgi:hypothetical protein